MLFTMKKQTFLIITILLFSTVLGCKADVADAFRKAGDLESVFPGQTIKSIPKDSELFVWVSAWLKSHRDCWSYSAASYIPGYIIRGENFNLNINETFAVINYKDTKDKYHQYIRKLDIDDYQSFKIAAGIQSLDMGQIKKLKNKIN